MTTIILKGGAKVWVDSVIDKGRCKACHKTVYWATTENAKKMPICQDKGGAWISHFYDCPRSKDFHRKSDYIPQTNGIDSIPLFERRGQ